jgi:hypothetical protein
LAFGGADVHFRDFVTHGGVNGKWVLAEFDVIPLVGELEVSLIDS